MPKPIVKPEYKTAAFTKEEIAERIKLGAKIYKDIDSTKGAVVNYQSRDIISYTWDDFTNLVLYEKENKLPHHYSAMIAINLLKKNIYTRQIKFLNGAEKDVSIGTVQECISEYMDELYMVCLKRIDTWDATIGVYFDQYIKMDIKSLAETVGSFNQYGTGRNARLDAENRAKEPAIPYYEKLMEKDENLVHSDKHPRMAPSHQKRHWHFIPGNLNTRPAEDLYILKHEEPDDPDNPYLKDDRIKAYVSDILSKIDDLEFLKNSEKKEINRAITNMYMEKETSSYSKSTMKSIERTERLLGRKNIYRGPKQTLQALDKDNQLVSDSAVKCYLLNEKGKSFPEIAKEVGVKEKNVYAYIRATDKFVKNMQSKDFGCKKEECLWYLGVYGNLSARTTNILLREGYISVNEFKGMSTSELIKIRGITDERLKIFASILKDYKIELSNIDNSQTKDSANNNSLSGNERKIRMSEKLEIGKYCIEHGKNYLQTAEKYHIKFSQVLEFMQLYEEKQNEKQNKRQVEIERDA